MKALSFNLLCYGPEDRRPPVRKKYICAQIMRELPDAFGVQEATPEWMKILGDELSDTYAFVGEGRDGDGQGEHSAIFYKKDKLDLVDTGTFWLSETPDRVSHGWDGACKRVCTWAVLKCKKHGKEFAFLNTHLDHVGPVAMIEGCKMVVDKAKSFDVPVIITGDFNNTPDSEVYKHVISSGFTDSRTAPVTTDSCTFTGFYTDHRYDAIIDFIFVKGFEPETFKVIDEVCDYGFFASDHFAVVAELKRAD